MCFLLVPRDVVLDQTMGALTPAQLPPIRARARTRVQPLQHVARCGVDPLGLGL